MTWPLDADGDVFRKLAERGFDFHKQYLIDFNIDFASWPPSSKAVELLRTRYSSATVYEPSQDQPGYILVQLYSHLEYEFVTRVQSEITELVRRFGGSCESWGVLH